MTLTPNTIASRIQLDELDWAFEDYTPADLHEAEELIREEIRECIAEGIYPKSTELVKAHRNSTKRYGTPILVSISVDPTEVLEFYTAYCGGDGEHAQAELESMGLDFE